MKSEIEIAKTPTFDFLYGKNILKQCGVYCIHNKVNGKNYIGSTNSFFRRLKEHRSMLASGCHPNPHLQSAFDKYGNRSFQFQILETGLPEKLPQQELHWMQHLDSTNRKMGYNIETEPQNRSKSEETKIKMSRARMGVKSPNKGKRMSQEQKVKISNSLLGHKFSDETRAKIRLACAKRKIKKEQSCLS